MTERRDFDLASYSKLVETRGCFICGLVSGDPAFAHHLVYEDEFAIAFLNKFSPLKGYVLVCPKAHLEQVAGDFGREDYLRLQALVYDIGQALRASLPTERLYILSLGSQQANRHVHWHVAPLPPGVPLPDQQFAALDAERAGVLAMGEVEMEKLAGLVATAIQLARKQ